jgi:hypothetical protein
MSSSRFICVVLHEENKKLELRMSLTTNMVNSTQVEKIITGDKHYNDREFQR